MPVPGRVIVVGAGAAGLTAALALTTAGSSVTVLERAATPGGRAGTTPLRVADEEWRFDTGAGSIASSYRATRHVARQAGFVRQDMSRRPPDDLVVMDGRRFPLPVSMPAMMRTPLLSRASKRRVVSLGGRLGAPSSPAWSRLVDSADLDDEDAAGYFSRRIGRDYTERVLPAAMDALMLSPATATSRVLGMALFTAAPDTARYTPYGGLGALWSAVAARQAVRYDTTVTGVERSRDGVAVRTASGAELTADAVVLAGPASLAAHLLPDDHPDRPLAETAEFSPAVQLHLALAAPVVDRPLRPTGPGRHALAGVEPLETRRTGQVPDGRAGLMICAGPALGAELLDEPDRVVRTMLLAESERLVGGPVGDILGWSVRRSPEGVPLFRVGWLRRLREHQQRTPRTFAEAGRIHVAGDWLSSPSVEGAVRSALHACAQILRGR